MPVANTNQYLPGPDGSLVIVTRRGDRFLIDPEDAVFAVKHCWSRHESGYARAVARTREGTLQTVYLHRLILPTTEARPHVDHVNGDPADNRKQNLRACTRSQNMQNAKRRLDNRSGIKGVRFHPTMGLWSARLKIQGKVVFYGTFPTKEQASTAISEARVHEHGEFARHE